MTELTDEPSLQVVGWLLRRKRDGFIRAAYTSEPSVDQLAIADFEQEEYVPCFTQAAIAKYQHLYTAVNEMMASLGCHGEISNRNDRVQAVSDALHEIDGGIIKPNDAQAAISEKYAEVDRLKKDAARLDFLEKLVSWTHSGDGHYVSKANFKWGDSIKRRSLREAIDPAIAAMTQEAKP